jgi:phosphoserine phosphatase
MTPAVPEVISALQLQGLETYIVSGGYRECVLPFATHIGVPQAHVYANVIQFDSQGKYVRLDPKIPLWKSGGKLAILRKLRQRHPEWRFIMVGDGMSDAEVADEVDAFVYFGGHVMRAAVAARADYIITECSLAPLLGIVDRIRSAL